MSGIELSEAIKQLREQLMVAMAEGADKVLHFRPNSVEVELALEMKQEGGVGAKIKFWVVELGADGKIGRTSTHKLKLNLTPVDAEGEPIRLISNTDIERPGPPPDHGTEPGPERPSG